MILCGGRVRCVKRRASRGSVGLIKILIGSKNIDKGISKTISKRLVTVSATIAVSWVIEGLLKARRSIFGQRPSFNFFTEDEDVVTIYISSVISSFLIERSQ